MLTCAWLPPTFVTELGTSVVLGGGAAYWLAPDASRLPAGASTVALSDVALATCAVRRDLRDRERVRLLAALLSERVAGADVDRGASAQIGQCEVHAAVAAEHGAQQREQGLVLVDRQQLTVAHRPALGGEDEAHHADL